VSIAFGRIRIGIARILNVVIGSIVIGVIAVTIFAILVTFHVPIQASTATWLPFDPNRMRLSKVRRCQLMHDTNGIGLKGLLLCVEKYKREKEMMCWWR
jgi:hypothetical protein